MINPQTMVPHGARSKTDRRIVTSQLITITSVRISVKLVTSKIQQNFKQDSFSLK